MLDERPRSHAHSDHVAVADFLGFGAEFVELVLTHHLPEQHQIHVGLVVALPPAEPLL